MKRFFFFTPKERHEQVVTLSLSRLNQLQTRLLRPAEGGRDKHKFTREGEREKKKQTHRLPAFFALIDRQRVQRAARGDGQGAPSNTPIAPPPPHRPSPGALGGGCGKALAVGRRGGHIPPSGAFCKAALNHKGALPSHYEGGSGVKKKK